jgi:hypothetical protein
MGIFAFRNNQETASIISECSNIHEKSLEANPRFGDDDVITQYFVSHDRDNRIFLLPQQSFPVGNLVNLFLPISPLRGLRPDFPYIYHANFVVGSRKKEFLLKLITFRNQRYSLFKVLFLYIKLGIFQVSPLTKRILRKLRLVK